MERTPVEIMKGLECCITDNCKECPYYPLYEVFGCKLARAKDALALIQQLEKEVKRLESGMDHEKKITEAQMELIECVEAERDAAVDGMKSNCTCPECKYFSDDIQDPCRSCKPNASKFEWRGLQKEESDA